MAITAVKRQRPVADVATLFGDIGESRFLSKKVAKWYKRLKYCLKQRPKTEETDRCHQKGVAAAIARILLKAMAH
jgi:hypothetical protein